MELFSAKDIQEREDKRETEAKNRLRRLWKAETETGQRLAVLRADYETEKARINDELQKAEAALTERIASLTRQVRSLEARKEEARRPIVTREREQKMTARELAEEAARIGERKAALNLYASELEEKARTADTREAEISKMSEDVSAKAKSITDAEEKMAGAEEEIALARSSFEEYRRDALQRIEGKEKAIEEERKGIERALASIAVERQKNADERRALKDAYDTLAKAREEILGRKT